MKLRGFVIKLRSGRTKLRSFVFKLRSGGMKLRSGGTKLWSEGIKLRRRGNYETTEPQSRRLLQKAPKSAIIGQDKFVLIDMAAPPGSETWQKNS